MQVNQVFSAPMLKCCCRDDVGCGYDSDGNSVKRIYRLDKAGVMCLGAPQYEVRSS